MATSSTLVMSSKVYDILKQVTTTVLPAFSAAYLSLSQIWGFPHPEQVVASVAAINTVLGVLLTVASSVYASNAETDGTLEVSEGEDGKTLQLVVGGTTAVDEIAGKTTVTFAVENV